VLKGPRQTGAARLTKEVLYPHHIVIQYREGRGSQESSAPGLIPKLAVNFIEIGVQAVFA